MEISMKFAPNQTGSAASNHIPAVLAKSDAFKELESLIGLKEVKRAIAEVCAFAVIQKKRSERNLKSSPAVLHMLFRGNPGTGKTTVARLLGKILYEIGMLSKGHLIEAERADLVGEYIGHTAQKTRELIKKALGGILFIDEAYTLAQGGEKDFGQEAVATLVKAMEDKKNQFVAILAGYCAEMDHFIASNPGLRSRFPMIIDFPNYSSDELFEIALQMYAQREYELSSHCRWKLKCYLDEFVSKSHPHSGNARYIRNLVEKSIRLQAMRIIDKEFYSKKDLMTIEVSDLPLT